MIWLTDTYKLESDRATWSTIVSEGWLNFPLLLLVTALPPAWDLLEIWSVGREVRELGDKVEDTVEERLEDTVEERLEDTVEMVEEKVEGGRSVERRKYKSEWR